MNLPGVRSYAQVPVREVSHCLRPHLMPGAILCGFLAPTVLLLFGGQTGQIPVAPSDKEAAEHPKSADSAQWVPLVATHFQESTPDWPGHVPEKIVLGGPYLRNQDGSSYQRLRVVSKNSVPIRVEDVATLFDRPKGLVYRIDYAHRTVEVERQKSDEMFFQVKQPLTREQFITSHASDQYLGASTFEAFDCELYKVRGKAKKGRFDGVVCYAPALNFLAVRAQFHPSQGTTTDMYLQDIQIGRRPGSEYFEVPQGFKIIDKTK